MPIDYDLIVIGAGAAGLTASAVASTVGARTLLVERERMGGDCTWTGCVPSKSLLRAAHAAHSARTAGRLGIDVNGVTVDFGRVMERVRTLRNEIYEDADAPEIYERMGVDVVHGEAAFVDDRTIEIRSASGVDAWQARRFIIATGASPAVPPVPGLDGVPYLTNETIFELRHRPEHLLILGAGPVGVEMAQAFRRLGTRVTVLDTAERILGRDDEELATMTRAVLEEEGIRFLLDVTVQKASISEDLIQLRTHAGDTVRGDALLVATGRRPNVHSLNLEAAGVYFGEQGVEVDDRCRTSNGAVFAAGDVTGRYAFTHVAEHMARTAVMNALLKVPSRLDTAHVPWVTYTDPELAHVGATQMELEADGVRFETFRFPYGKLDRALMDDAATGLIKVHARGWNGRILGASILGARAGDMISELALAMRMGVRLRQISDTMHPYPSYGLGVRRAADQWYVRRHAPWMVRVIQKVFGYRGPVTSFSKHDVV